MRSTLFFLALLLVLLPVSFQKFIDSVHADNEVQTIAEDTVWSGEKLIEGNYFVEEGSTLKVEKGSKLIFKSDASIEIQGVMNVDGTVLSPVILEKENVSNKDETYYIFVSGHGELNVNNADISGGGNMYDAVPESLNREFTSTASAETFYTGVINAYEFSKIVVQATKFHNNKVAIHTALDSKGANDVVVSRSSFENNNVDVVHEYYQAAFDFRYNWWGSADGPNPDKIVGAINTMPFRLKKELRDPVIIVPGILGSQEKNGGWVIDPLFHTYDNLYNFLIAQGYVPNVDLFVFPYDWYQSNVDTAMLLREKVLQITRDTDWPKVDIVAHSMGGLVARQYIENDQNSAAKIDQLVTLGTPHNGAPESYLMWEGGDYYDDVAWKREAANLIISYLAFKRGETKYEYIHNIPVASVQELLPVYPYLKDKDSGDLRSYPDNHPWNAFLDALNQPEKVANLSKIEFSNIVGKTNLDDSITEIRTDDPSKEGAPLWEHGKPDGYDNLFGDKGLERGTGDGTVPLSSADNIPSDLQLETNSGHSDLPTKVSDRVFTILNGFDPLVRVDPVDFRSVMLVQLYSPIDVQIVSPSGKRVGKNFEMGGVYDEIPGAFYTGYDTENEFVTIPNPEEGEYRILTQGTGEGEYRVETTNIAEGEEGEEVKESKVTFTGTAETGVTEEKKVVLADDEVAPIEDGDVVPPEVSIVSPENSKEYLNNTLLPVIFTVTDDVSLEENISKEIRLDGEALAEMVIDLPLHPLGTHTLSVQATDEAGNTVSQTVSFTSRVMFWTLLRNIDHYHDLGLIKEESDTDFIKDSVKRLEITEKLINKTRQSPLPPRIKAPIIAKLEKDQEREKASLEQFFNEKTEAGMIDILVKERVMEAVEILTQ